MATSQIPRALKIPPVGAGSRYAPILPGRVRAAIPLRLFSGWWGCLALLTIYFLLAVFSGRQFSNTYDELPHIAGGVSYWATGQYRINPESGIIPQRWEGLWALLGGARWRITGGGSWDISEEWDVGHALLYQTGNSPERILAFTRAGVALFTVSLGCLVYAWSRRLFGRLGAILSVSMFAFSPLMLSHGALATADAAVTLFFFLSVWAIWRLLEQITLARTLFCALAVGLLFMSKFSAVLILPVAGLMVISRIFLGPISVRPSRGKLLASYLGIAMLLVLLIWGMIWACYGFRYAALGPDDGQPGITLHPGWEFQSEIPTVPRSLVQFSRAHHLLPEAYLYGFAYTVRSSMQRAAWWNGEYSTTGWGWYFPYALLVKTPIGFIMLLVLAAVAWMRQSRAEILSWHAGFYRTAPLWVFITVYLAFAMKGHLNIGYRHMMPIFPALFVLAGSAGWWLERWRGWFSGVTAAAAGWAVAVGVWSYPNYLAYFNEFVGGYTHGYHHLVDSNVDWGQDLPRLRNFLIANHLNQQQVPVYLAYFGTASPWYYGIQALVLPGLHRQPEEDVTAQMLPFRGGVYCVSATLLQGAATVPGGAWTTTAEATYQLTLERLIRNVAGRLRPGESALNAEDFAEDFRSVRRGRVARLCAYLRRRQPIANIGGSILLFQLAGREAADIDNGPPELVVESTAP